MSDSQGNKSLGPSGAHWPEKQRAPSAVSWPFRKGSPDVNPVLQVLQKRSDIVLATTPWGRHCSPHFTDERTEA